MSAAAFTVHLTPGPDLALAAEAAASLAKLPPDRIPQIPHGLIERLGNLVADENLHPTGLAGEFDLSIRPDLTDGDRIFLSALRAGNLNGGHRDRPSTGGPNAADNRNSALTFNHAGGRNAADS